MSCRTGVVHLSSIWLLLQLFSNYNTLDPYTPSHVVAAHVCLLRLAYDNEIDRVSQKKYHQPRGLFWIICIQKYETIGNER